MLEAIFGGQHADGMNSMVDHGYYSFNLTKKEAFTNMPDRFKEVKPSLQDRFCKVVCHSQSAPHTTEF